MTCVFNPLAALQHERPVRSIAIKGYALCGVGGRSWTGRCHRPSRATAFTDPCRLQGMPPTHEFSGDRHYPCRFRFANEDRRRRENAGSGLLRGGDRRLTSPMGAIKKSNWTQGTAFPPDSAAHSLRMHPCRDTGNRAMNVQRARYQAAERAPGREKDRSGSDMRGISVCCAAFRTARSRSLRFQTTRDSCRYRA